jgi:hypothetical protein
VIETVDGPGLPATIGPCSHAMRPRPDLVARTTLLITDVAEVAEVNRQFAAAREPVRSMGTRSSDLTASCLVRILDGVGEYPSAVRVVRTVCHQARRHRPGPRPGGGDLPTTGWRPLP